MSAAAENPEGTTRSRARRSSLLGILFLGGVLVVGLLVDASADSATLAGFRGPPCLLAEVMGDHACPGCGLTRSTALTLAGEPERAIAVHPAGPLVVLLSLLGLLVHSHAFFAGSRTRHHEWLLRWGRRVFVSGLLITFLFRLI